MVEKNNFSPAWYAFWKKAWWTILRTGIITVVIILALCLGFHSFSWWLCGSPAENVGTFGDQYGALNTFFSGLAFTGLVIAILLQREDLKLQWKIMNDARIESEQRTKATETQTKLLKEQMLNQWLHTYLTNMRTEKQKLQEQISHANSDSAPIDIFEGLKTNILNFIKLLDNKDHEKIETYNQWIDKLVNLQNAINDDMLQLRSIVYPIKLWYRHVYHSLLSDSEKKAYANRFFDDLTPEENFSVRLYEIVMNSPLNPYETMIEPPDIAWVFLLKDEISRDADTLHSHQHFNFNHNDLYNAYYHLISSSIRNGLCFFRPRH